MSGVPNLGIHLSKAGLFSKVLDCPTTSILKSVITGQHLKGIQSNSLVFIVGDAVVEDDLTFPISDFLRKVTSAGYNVIIVSVTPKGMDLYKQHPKSVLLHLPISINAVLYAISTFGINVSPVENGVAEIEISTNFQTTQHRNTQHNTKVFESNVNNSPPTSGWAPVAPVVDLNNSLKSYDSAPSNSITSEPKGSPPISNYNSPGAATAPNPIGTNPFASFAVSNTQTTSFTPPTNAVDNQPAYTDRRWLVNQGGVDSSRVANQGAGGYVDGSQFGSTQQPNSTPNPFPVQSPQNNNSLTQSNRSVNDDITSNRVFGGNWVPPQRTLSDLREATSSQSAFQVNSTPYSNQTQGAIQSSVNPLGAGNPASWSPSARFGSNQVIKAKRRGYVITVSVSKGGTGKSSMTLNLAAFLGMRLRSQGKTVCVIDANTQQADSGKYLDVYHPNISTIVNDPNLLTEDRILSSLVHRPEYNLSVLLGPSTPDEANPLAINPRLYTEVLELLKTHYDYVLIDTPVAEKFHEMFSEFALAKADYLIVPVTQNVQTLHNADNWLRAAVVAPRHEGGAAFDRNRIGVVLNRAEEGVGFTEDDVRATMANWHYIGSIPETKEWKLANNRNELVAPKNFADLSHAFAEVLHAATSEPSLLENFSTLEAPRQGFLDKVLGKVFKR
ncbi:MAG: CpaE family protein [Candidatus Paceibacterota bacterium]